MIGAARLVVIGILCAVWYAWFTDEAVAAETIAAVLVGCAAALVSARIDAIRPQRVRVALDATRVFVIRVLPAMFLESFELIGPVLWNVLVRRKMVTGRWIALRYDPRDRSDAAERGRRGVVIFGSNLTPNALPLDVDVRAGRLILHQLVARREAAASDPRYPM